MASGLHDLLAAQVIHDAVTIPDASGSRQAFVFCQDGMKLPALLAI